MGLVKLSEIRRRYPKFKDIFKKHIQDAKFDGAPIKSRSFRDLKLGVVSLLHILDEHQRLGSETRSALFQALVVEHNFQQALNSLPRKSSILTQWISSFWSDTGECESFKSEMKRSAAEISDSKFLQNIESIDDEDLRSAVQKARGHAKRELSSLIDAMVKMMTHDILIMQQDVRGRQAQLEVENKEREVLKTALVGFIREINKTSAKELKS